MKFHVQISFLTALIFLGSCPLFAQQDNRLWHGIEREVHYRPDGEDFVLVNGKRRFNRALYGGNTAFRAEGGDLPEFALYLPGMGGNLKFGLVKGDSSKWLIQADQMETRYRPGSMIYTIEDALLGNGSLSITALTTFDAESFIVKIEGKNLPADLILMSVFGGATGQKFSREGDIGADPESSFDLKPAYCRDNIYQISNHHFQLYFGSKKPLTEEERYEIQHLPAGQKDTTTKGNLKVLSGVFPAGTVLKISDAAQQEIPLSFLKSKAASAPALSAQVRLRNNEPLYFLLQNKALDGASSNLAAIFTKAEASRKKMAGRIKVSTPDPFINTLGGALSMAADAIWDEPSYMHGAVAWRMRLPGWRGAYVADVLGWHDRARKNFDGYALSQVTEPAAGPVVMDTALHLGRGLEKMGTSMFSSGYISRNPGGDKRPHHYDMNLVYVDQLLNHFNWTGDTAYVKKMWPLLVRHFDWGKRNFDTDGDGLYDAYAAIWASDALQYSGGGVAHSSAYNYRANKTAAQLARLIGEDAVPFQKEADKILAALQSQLWLPEKGWLAEYKDLLGEKRVHPYAGLWTIYHALDSRVSDPFQAYQMLRYVDTEIPRIPIRAKGLKDTSLYTLSTTAWQPYTWSLNNVALAELLHTSLAYWQGSRNEEAYRLWKSSLVESFYLGASPGNFQQLSFYDAVRGELYRDFADPIGMAGRSLVEGLFGIEPQLLQNRLLIRPGFPADWNRASLSTPDINYSFQRTGNKDQYRFKTAFGKKPQLFLQLKASMDGVSSVLVNGKKGTWQFDTTAVGQPLLTIEAPAGESFLVEVVWKGLPLEKPSHKSSFRQGETIRFAFKNATILRAFDPQNTLAIEAGSGKNFTAFVNGADGTKTFFLQLKQGAATYWLPVTFTLGSAMAKAKKSIGKSDSARHEKIALTPFFNADVKDIFKNVYHSPRPNATTLQLPTQGIGNWAYPLTMANIDDRGLRKRAGEKREVVVQGNIPLSTPSDTGAKNIIYTSQWDNYPKEVTIPLQGKASGVYLLMAGSTNSMQSRFTNGEVVVTYTDGTTDKLELKNPENWWPIEQDLMEDGFAFHTGAPKPLRVYLKTGEDTKTFSDFTTIKGFSNRGIDGGAATVLELPLDASKDLKSLTVKTIANDVVIGLMSATLVRP